MSTRMSPTTTTAPAVGTPSALGGDGYASRQVGVAQDDLDVGAEALATRLAVEVLEQARRDRLAPHACRRCRGETLGQQPIVQRLVALVGLRARENVR